jgi:hypothetical protein
VLTCLLLAVGVAAFVYVNYIDNDDPPGKRRRPRTTQSVPSKAPTSAAPNSVKSVASASADSKAPDSGAPSSGAPSSGAPSSGAPASVPTAGAVSNASAAPKTGAPASAAPASAAPAVGPIALTIRSNPGAEVFEGKNRLGKVPVVVSLDPGQKRRLSFRLKGHKSKTWVVDHAKFIKRAKDGKASAGIRLKKKVLENPYDKKLDNPY